MGTPPAQIHPTAAGVVRFGTGTMGLTMPSTLPRAGWLLGIGSYLNNLQISKLAPGVTQADLDADNICFTRGMAPRRRTALCKVVLRSPARFRRGPPCSGTTA